MERRTITQYQVATVAVLDGGLVTSVSSRMIDQTLGFSSKVKNYDFTLQGLPKKRPGIVRYTDVPELLTGLHEFVKLSTGDNFLIISFEDTVQAKDGKDLVTDWEHVYAGFESGEPVYFLTMADQVVMANGIDPIVVWNGEDPATTNVGTEKASMRTFLLFDNNDLEFTARSAGEDGNNIRVKYERAASHTSSISVDVSGYGTEENPYVLTVKLAWDDDEEESITSTAQHVKNVIEGRPAANNLVTVEHVRGSDGSREVTVMPERPLTGGHDAAIGKYLCEYRLRAVIADGSFLHLSHTGDPTLWSPYTVGSNAMGAYVSPDDGEAVSGLLNMGDGGMLIGKPNALYGLFGYKRDNFIIEMIDPEIGVSSHKSMVYIRPYAYWVWKDGIYRSESADTPQRISHVIDELFDELVDKELLHTAVAFVYDLQYVVSLPKKGGGHVAFCWHIEREKWTVWTQPSGLIDKTFTELYDEAILFANLSDSSIYRIDKDALRDFEGDPEPQFIDTELRTIELDAGFPYLEKDIGDLYIVFRTYDEKFSVTVDVFLDGWEEPKVHTTTEIEGPYGKQKVLRVPVGRTARFMEVVISDRRSKKQITPMALYYTYQLKEVL